MISEQSAERVDAAIDIVAAKMTSAEPSSDLRDRVMTRLEATSGVHWLSWMGLLSAAGAVALFVLSLPHPNARMRIATNSVGRTAANERASVPTAERQAPGATFAASVVQSQARHFRPQGRVESIRSDSQIPALEAPAPITMSSIQPKPLEIRPLVTEPLVIAPLEPLDAP
jgi:hypothetical protein